ncbi:MAG TPA: type III-A CRISPR-associated protein Cas10/Csm1 [Sedimentibacter sp.]|nr:type III-A CRISPR-associated protein Cas10/Csm1 [Sedimentibacter sp.]
MENAKESLNRWLYSEFGTLLYIEMAYIEACAYDFMFREGKPASTANCFKRLSDKISEGKLSRYSRGHLEEIFDINTPQEAHRECGICGSSIELVDWEDEGKAICKGCRSLVKIGEKLVYRYDDTMVIPVLKGYDEKGIKLPEVFGEGSCTLVFDTLENIRAKLDDSLIKRVYSKNKMIAGFKGANRIFAADYSWCTESKNNKPVEFEKLVNDAEGIKRLGVLRADVDNLGRLFSNGFRMGEDTNGFQTLGRYISISKSLTRFFKDSINKIAGNEKIKKSLAIVYSGGDDVFAVGPWNQVIEFARDLRKAFEEFTCGALSFSAGIGFYEHKYPVSRMAEETGQLENYSKTIDEGKDRIALFGMEGIGGKTLCKHVYKWKEFDRVMEKADFLFDYLNDDKNPSLGKTKLYKYLKLINEAENNEGISIARFAYTLGRQCPGNNAEKEKLDRYNMFKNNMYSWITDINERKELATAIQLTIYKIRNEGGEKNG